MKRVKILKLCCVVSALLLSGAHNGVVAAAVEDTGATPCSRFVTIDGTPADVSDNSIAHYFTSSQGLKEFTETLTTSVKTFLEGTWRLQTDDFCALTKVFESFLQSMEGLGEAGLSPEKTEALYNDALEKFCTLHGEDNKFASKEWLERYSTIYHKCIPKPGGKTVLTDDAKLNIQLAIRFHFVLPDSWVEVLVDTALRTDPLQMHRYFFEEVTVQENPHFFLKYELLGKTRRHPIETDTLNARFSSNHKPDLVELTWRYLRNATRPIYRNLRLNVLFSEPESLLTERQFAALLESNALPPYPKTEEQANDIFKILHGSKYSEEQINKLGKYDMTNAIQRCIAAAEAVSMHFENVKLVVDSQSQAAKVA